MWKPTMTVLGKNCLALSNPISFATQGGNGDGGDLGRQRLCAFVKILSWFKHTELHTRCRGYSCSKRHLCDLSEFHLLQRFIRGDNRNYLLISGIIRGTQQTNLPRSNPRCWNHYVLTMYPAASEVLTTTALTLSDTEACKLWVMRWRYESSRSDYLLSCISGSWCSTEGNSAKSDRMKRLPVQLNITSSAASGQIYDLNTEEQARIIAEAIVFCQIFIILWSKLLSSACAGGLVNATH